MAASGRERDFAVFDAYCLDRSTKEGSSRTYGQIATDLGVTETAVRKGLERCRLQLREILRRTIRQYVTDPEEVETEFRRLAGT